MTAARDRFAQIRKDKEHAAELAWLDQACEFCGAVHPSIVNHGPDGYDLLPGVERVGGVGSWAMRRAPARKRGRKGR